jgi:glycosyltransferase involved in cell wall biosynthesis
LQFSVVIPVYNTQEYLPECLASLDAQTFTDFEAVIVDDGSSDASGEIARAWADARPGRVRVLENGENLGLLQARARGFAAAEGDYIVSLDADDALRPDALETIAGAIERYGCDIVHYTYARRADFSDPVPMALEPGRVYGSVEMRRAFLDGAIVSAIWSKAFSRRLVDGAADVARWGRLNLYEDGVFTSGLFDAAESLVFIGEALYRYRPNEASITRTVRDEHLNDIERTYECLAGHAARWKRDDPGAPELDLLAQGLCMKTLANFTLAYPQGRTVNEARAMFGRIRGTALLRDYAASGYEAEDRDAAFRLVEACLKRGTDAPLVALARARTCRNALRRAAGSGK